MKRIISIALIVLLSVGVLTAADLGQSGDTIHAYIVLDCGRADMETWEMLRARAIEVICTLNAGDRVTVITAHQSGARLYLDGEISSDKTSVDAIVKKIATLSKDWVVRADISAATAFAYERMAMPEPARQGCAVLTTGDMRDDEFAGMVHVAGLFAARKVPLTLICEHTKTNRQLLLSGIDLHYLDKPAIAEWLGKVRPVAQTKAEPNLSKVPESPKPVEGGKTKVAPMPSVIVSPPVQPQPTPTPPKAPAPRPTVVPDVNSSKPAAVKPNPSVDSNRPAKTPLPPLAKRTEPNDANQAKTEDAQKAQAKAGEHNSTDAQTRSSSFSLWYVWVPVVLGIVVGGILLLKKLIGRSRSVDKAEDADEIPMILVAYVGDDRRELGSLKDIREIIIGSGLGCTVFISGADIASQHLKITRSRGGFKLKNCADAAVTLNGSSVEPKGKTVLDLPAEIEITADIVVTIVEESQKIVNGKELI